MKKLINVLIIVTVGISLFIVIGFTATQAVAYSDTFYQRQFEKNLVSVKTGIPTDELKIVADAIQDFLKDEREDLVVHSSVNGEYRELFNADEKSHMQDVKNVFFGFSVARSICLVFLAALSLISLKGLVSLSDILRRASLFVFCFGTALGGCVALFFDQTFTLFHALFFKGDTWLFDARTTLLVNILPEEFFVSCAVVIVVSLVVSLAAIYFLSTMIYKSKGKSIER